MPSDKPTRLRRAPLGGANPPVGSTIGTTTILPPVEIGAGGEVEGGSSNPAASASTARTNYRDEASPPKGAGQSTVNAKAPFELTKP